jgi:hypothetical protein
MYLVNGNGAPWILHRTAAGGPHQHRDGKAAASLRQITPGLFRLRFEPENAVRTEPLCGGPVYYAVVYHVGVFITLEQALRREQDQPFCL